MVAPAAIKKVIVHYENGQTDEWEGETGYVRKDSTIVKDGPGKLEHDVIMVSAHIVIYRSEWRRSH